MDCADRSKVGVGEGDGLMTGGAVGVLVVDAAVARAGAGVAAHAERAQSSPSTARPRPIRLVLLPMAGA
jgi:hypothetical protein